MKVNIEAALALATNRFCGASVGEVQAAMSHVLGWDVFSHELAEERHWKRARALVLSACPELIPFADEVDWASNDEAANKRIVEEARRNIGETVELPQGKDQRREHPFESLRRIALGKPVVVVTKEPEVKA